MDLTDLLGTNLYNSYTGSSEIKAEKEQEQERA